MNITARCCANCVAFNEVPGVACSLGGNVVGRSLAANDVCPRHRTDQEEELRKYELPAADFAPSALANAGGSLAW
jgi:hypothetical protein